MLNVIAIKTRSQTNCVFNKKNSSAWRLKLYWNFKASFISVNSDR